MNIDDLNCLVSELRSPNLRLLYFWQIIETYKGLPREYAQIARPYMRAHKDTILKHTREGAWQPIVDAIDTLPIDELRVEGYSVYIARYDARGVHDKIRRAYREGHCVEITLSIVAGAPISLYLTHTAPYVTCEAISLAYQGRWYYDEARAHASAIQASAEEQAGLVCEGESVWSVWRATLHVACEHVDGDQWIHETYEQDSYTQAVIAAEWAVICEVASALHPDRTYREFRDADPDTEVWTEIQAFSDALYDADIYAETKEACGEISACLSNSAQLREILAQFAQEWHGPGADPEEIQSAIERAMDWVF